MDWSREPIEDFLEALSSAAPTPGGGGAAALAGALGAALGCMVGNLTLKKAPDPALAGMLAEAEEIRRSLTALIRKDAEAFAPLSAAYKLDKTAPGSAETLERCLRDAARPPLEMVRLCRRMLELLAAFEERGSALTSADARAGAALCRGALAAAAESVYVNTRLMADRDYAQALDAEVAQALA